MFRRRPPLTQQEKADRKWERMASQPRTMGMVGIFNDLNPGAKHAEAQIVHERETFADQEAEGETPSAGDGFAGYADPRSPSGTSRPSAWITVTPNLRDPHVQGVEPEGD